MYAKKTVLVGMILGCLAGNSAAQPYLCESTGVSRVSTQRLEGMCVENANGISVSSASKPNVEIGYSLMLDPLDTLERIRYVRILPGAQDTKSCKSSVPPSQKYRVCFKGHPVIFVSGSIESYEEHPDSFKDNRASVVFNCPIELIRQGRDFVEPKSKKNK